MAGRKVFTSGEILTAADVNSFLMDQSVMVFADSSARSSAIPSPTEGMVTYVEDANRVEVYDGAAFGPIGGILQVVSTTKTDTFSSSSTSLTDITGLSVSITPSSTASKIFVSYSVSYGISARGTQPKFRLMRDATPIAVGDTVGTRTSVTSGGWGGANSDAEAGGQTGSSSAEFLDTPSTTSELVYKVQIFGDSGTRFINRPSTDTDDPIAARARSVSTITVMEVAV